jgi:hypothetical protein
VLASRSIRSVGANFTVGHSLSMMENATVSRTVPFSKMVVTKHTVLHCTKVFDRGSGLTIVPMGPKLHRDAAQLLERPCQEEKFRCRVDAGAGMWVQQVRHKSPVPEASARSSRCYGRRVPKVTLVFGSRIAAAAPSRTVPRRNLSCERCDPLTALGSCAFLDGRDYFGFRVRIGVHVIPVLREQSPFGVFVEGTVIRICAQMVTQ